MYTRKDLHRAAVALILFAVHIASSAQNSNEFGYPIAPDLTSSINAPVGKIGAELTVLQSGASSYSVGIETPIGVSGTAPSLSLSYNSQAGNGIAGWGCNLTGLSVITRMPNDIYRDGHADGLTYNMDGPFCLDGQRLLQIGSLQDGDSIKYRLEFSPHTIVVLHGLSSSSQEATWFSVHTPDGNDSEYGHTAESQQRYTLQGTVKVNAWYVNSVRNPLGGQRNYSYTQWNNGIYPQNISYGNNIVRFTYEARPDTISTAVEGIPLLMTKRLCSVVTGTIVNGVDSIFRRYTFSYTCNDQTTTSFSRLSRIDVANGRGENLRPTILDWDIPSAFYCQKDTSSFDWGFFYLGAPRNSMSFSSADLNGDGLSDIVQYGYTNQPGGYSNNYPYIRPYYAHVGTNGTVSFHGGNAIRLSGGFSINSQWNQRQTAPVAADMNADGIAELMVPDYYFSPDGSHFGFFVYREGNIGQEVEGVQYYDLHVDDVNDILWTIGDYNNDGISEIVVIEKQTDGSNYYGVLMGGYQDVGEPYEAYNKPFRFALPAEPKHLFSADMDCDGLTDLVVFYNQGYSVIHNTGNWLDDNLASPYYPQHADYTLGMNPCKVWLGDFNGDLISDFLVCKPNCGDFYYELGNGDGSLTHKTACTLEIYDQPYDNDDLFFCQILDIDGDGKTDVVAHKSMYYDWFYDSSEVYWLRSDGNRLIVQSHASTTSMIDGEARFYTQGDFNGDGLQEIASYSFNCYDGTGSSGDAAFCIYKNSSYIPSKGRLIGVTDGLDRQTHITYSTLANANIRLQDAGNNIPSSPVIKVSAPLNVVTSIETDNGAAGHRTKNYQYGLLLGHVQGRGLLGMNSSRTEDISTGLVTNYQVTQWHPTAFVPSATTEIDSLGGQASTRNTTYYFYVGTSNNHNYYWYKPQKIINLDFDGNRIQEDYLYDYTWNMPNRHVITYGPYDFERTNIWDCVYKGGRYLPIDISYSKRYADDNESNIIYNIYTYNDMGLVDTVITNVETEMAVTKAYTYDTYGNRLTETTSANGVTPLVKTWQYDNSHRFVTRHTENGLTEILYTHDLWGNVLTETDNTRTAHPLTQTNTYDGWGNLTATISPIGIRNTYTKGWGNSQTMRYYEVVQGKKQPWKKTWFDAVGREVKTESISDQGLPTSKTTTYNNNGQAVSILNQTGNVSITQTSSYDNRGRCVSTSMSDTQGTLSQTRTYAYGSNWKSETFNGRTIKQTYNSRGDVVSVATPQDTVLYHYYSSGLPSSVTSCGHTVTMEYDIAGNRTKLTDPDAGTMTYTYDGLGRVISQTDARNEVLNYTYDNYGRVKTEPTGGSPLVTNFYGTNSSNKNLLIMVRVTPADKVNYTYDDYGRMITRKRLIPNYGFRTFTYTYDNDGLLASKTYPDGTTTSFQYDAYGNHVSTTIGDTIVWQMTNATGSTTQYLLANTFLMDETYNAYGVPTSKTLRRNGSQLHGMTFTYAPNTGNLTQRTGMFSYTENFAYDAQERLTQADNLGMTYSADGNILSKTDVGRYYYENAKPHAVTSIDNSCFLVSDSLQTIEYNSCGMVTDIHQSVGLELSVSYGPEGGREKCIFNCNGQTYKRLYFGDYEEEITSYGTKSICYLDGGVMAARGINGILSLRVSFTDNLGSITRIYNSSGLEQFNATYDAWGNQTIYKNSISFYRGYTGHEMLSDFGLINMNGRLYDPMLGRFLSTDNYVQMPYDSQNFNRYSYCLNNPLKYTDPSGEWFGLDDLLIAGVSFVVGYVSSGISSGNWGWSSVQSGLTTAAMSWIGFNTAGLATGAITSSTWKSVASTGINTIVNSMIPSINIPIGNFGLSFSPAFGFGEGGLNIGLNTGLSYSDGNWHFGVCAGMGSTYQGWYAETGYGKFSMGYGATYYNSTTIGDYIADRQIVGTGKLSWGDYSFSVSNDLFAESHKDRWRTSAVELGIGNFLIGTSVFTNWGAAESPVINGTKHIPVNDPYVGAHIFDKKDGKTYGSWRNGQVFSAPFWVGCRNGNQALRIGGSAKIVQSLTQNMVHKFMHTPYFIHYNNFKNGAFSYYGYYNPLTLWNN